MARCTASKALLLLPLVVLRPLRLEKNPVPHTPTPNPTLGPTDQQRTLIRFSEKGRPFTTAA